MKGLNLVKHIIEDDHFSQLTQKSCASVQNRNQIRSKTLLNTEHSAMHARLSNRLHIYICESYVEMALLLLLSSLLGLVCIHLQAVGRKSQQCTHKYILYDVL